jgi:hypothetical protein
MQARKKDIFFFEVEKCIFLSPASFVIGSSVDKDVLKVNIYEF